MSDEVRVRFVRPWRVYKPGDVILPPSGMADALVRQGLAAYDKQHELELAVAQPVVEHANATPRRKRR